MSRSQMQRPRVAALHPSSHQCECRSDTRNLGAHVTADTHSALLLCPSCEYQYCNIPSPFDYGLCLSPPSMSLSLLRSVLMLPFLCSPYGRHDILLSQEPRGSVLRYASVVSCLGALPVASPSATCVSKPLALISNDMVFAGWGRHARVWAGLGFLLTSPACGNAYKQGERHTREERRPGNGNN